MERSQLFPAADPMTGFNSLHAAGVEANLRPRPAPD